MPTGKLHVLLCFHGALEDFVTHGLHENFYSCTAKGNNLKWTKFWEKLLIPLLYHFVQAKEVKQNLEMYGENT